MMLPLLALCLPTVRSFSSRTNRLAVIPIRQRSTVTLAGSLRDLLENNTVDGRVNPGTMDINGQEKAKATATCRPVSTAVATPPARSAAQPVISISDSFDGGNAEFSGLKLVDGEEDFCDVHVTVNIRKDPFTELESKEHFQYFSFRSTLNRDAPAMKGLFQGKKSIKVKYILENAGEASYAHAFRGYSTFYTQTSPFDPDSWRRKDDTAFDGGALTWTHVHDLDSPTACFAYFPPYSYERHLGLVAKCAESGVDATVRSLGQSVEGREIDCVKVGNGPRTCWIIHRQHPGESMAEFYAEGLLTRLLGLDGKWDSVAAKAKELFTFHIVPNVNPDGSINGHLRTNAAGQNLNREWCPSPAPGGVEGAMYDAPTVERSPEVFSVLRAMDGTGCDVFLDVHGDEALPFNFLAGSEGMPVWCDRLRSLHGAFLASYQRANPDMQARVSYEPDEPGQGMPHICSNQIAQRFDCLAGTLEMPFKEMHEDTPERRGEDGWGPDRARRLGASVLDPLCYVQPHLRGDGWSELTDESDAYIRPTDKY